MRALIDGHNAIHALRLQANLHEELRRELARRVLAVDPDATIFFDAKRAGPLPFDSAREGGVRVLFCRHRDADDEILDAVRDAERPEELLVVTNDREVKGRAAQLGAQVSGVVEFFARPAPKGRAERGARRSPPRPAGETLPDRGRAANPAGGAPDLPSAGEGGEDHGRAPGGGGGFSPADFGLPDEIDTDDPDWR
ncbi:MAG: NYN domain-containing protein [Planctomycetaceae bacterium]